VSNFIPSLLRFTTVCCLAGNSKTASRILISLIAIGADYSYEVKNSEIWAPAFFKHNNSFIATVRREGQKVKKTDDIVYGWPPTLCSSTSHIGRSQQSLLVRQVCIRDRSRRPPPGGASAGLL
jgi:hypothetical protein